ncbi:type IV toxin-antitoxin system AbiEi family antitoxin domain-containing protein [Sphingomonas ginsengisoli (ex An et al. 2013)]|nr:type IV toxin-antitoxin system AbiEi family antitoxin domain-containing protein [Sphingomonas ginsengisoli An et al. 2013]
MSEILAAGATATAVSRLERDGTIVRLSRGLYQLADRPLEANQPLIEAAKLVSKGVICLVSALSYHELTDQIPRRVSMAIGPRDWLPQITYPPIRFFRFSPDALTKHVETRTIDGVDIRVTNPARTIVDLFKYRGKVGQNVAIDGLKEVFRQRRATPAEVHNIAAEMKQWKVMQPYVEALSFNG